MNQFRFAMVLFAPLWLGDAAQADARPPNIVLIVSDDQGYGDLGILNPAIKTPALDRLAKEGVRLTDFYVAWPACTPSRGSLMTGRYPQRNGLYDMIRNEAPDYGHLYTPEQYAVSFERIGGLDTREVLIPEVLGSAGYVCGMFGKWDSGSLRRYLPLQRGWDDYYGFVNTGIDYYTHERYGVPSMYRGNRPTVEDRGTYCTSLFEREALRFIDEHRERPFLLYLPFNAPHNSSSLDPAVRGISQAPREFLDMYPDLEEKYVDGVRYGKPAKVPTRQTRKKYYNACVTAMDAAIGNVLDRLDEFGLAENTLVVFFSDNGGSGSSNNTPLHGHKGSVYEGGVRVCCLMRYPGRIPAGSVCTEFLTALEMLPTFAGLASAPLPEEMVLDGFDLLPVVNGEAESSRERMFWKRRELEAARVGDWKLVRRGDDEELYDLANDLSETVDLSSKHPGKLRELQQAFADWTAEMERSEPRGPFRDY